MKQNSRIQLENTLIGALGVLSLVLFILSFLPGLGLANRVGIFSTEIKTAGAVKLRSCRYVRRDHFYPVHRRVQIREVSVLPRGSDGSGHRSGPSRTDCHGWTDSSWKQCLFPLI